MNREKPKQQAWLTDLITRALEEDIGTGDVTTNSIVGEQQTAKAVWMAKQSGVVAGLDIAEAVFRRLDGELTWKPTCKDGDTVENGRVLVEFEGKGRAILSAERVALNFAQRMSGIATKTAQMKEILVGYSTSILDTRKTVPGLRQIDKMAVKMGGGSNHRSGLYDMAMVKENHIRLAGSIENAVAKIRNQYPDIQIEVETTNLDEVEEALKAGADRIMLDNMDNETIREAVNRIDKRAETEASGNMSADRLHDVADTGVDFISAGTLTHSVQAFDISQQITEILEQKR